MKDSVREKLSRGFSEPHSGHPHKNLGKFLHPKKSGDNYKPSAGKPAASINRTVDANTGGAKVRATQ